MRVLIAVLLLYGAPCWAEDGQEPPPAPSVPKAADPPATERVFIPSETMDADAVVPFPADI